MKKCAYCGKSNDDDAVCCRECGTTEFKATPPAMEHHLESANGDGHASGANILRPPIGAQQILSIGGFAVLSGLFALGVTWIVVGIFGPNILSNRGSKLLAVIMPILITAGIIGFFVGLVISIRVVKSNPLTQETIEKKYVGRSGLSKIYSGAPFFIFCVVVSRCFDPLERHFGTTVAAYSTIGILMAIHALGMFAYDRIPRRLIVPVGIVGWLLIVVFILGIAFTTGSAWHN